MKQPFLFVALTGITIGGFAQKIKQALPPAAVKSAFEKAFPGASNTGWSNEKNDLEVNFVLQGKEMAAVYSNSGVLKETEEDISIAGLPAGVVPYIKAHYRNAAIKEAAKITSPDGTVTYEAEVNKKDLIFDAKGKFLHEVKDAA